MHTHHTHMCMGVDVHLVVCVLATCVVHLVAQALATCARRRAHFSPCESHMRASTCAFWQMGLPLACVEVRIFAQVLATCERLCAGMLQPRQYICEVRLEARAQVCVACVAVLWQ